MHQGPHSPPLERREHLPVSPLVFCLTFFWLLFYSYQDPIIESGQLPQFFLCCAWKNRFRDNL